MAPLGGTNLRYSWGAAAVISQTPINGSRPITGNTLVWWILQAALLFTLIAVFVPFSPGMPAAGLDESWSFAMNQAVGQGLSFGKELLSTVGPYASIYTRDYHP